MNREIKFRAWYENNKVMTKGFTLKHLLETAHNQSGLYWEQAQSYDVIMQYTGLKDKNGKEIYEGDIVKDEFDRIRKITFGFGGEGEPADYVGGYIGWCIGEDIDETTGFTNGKEIEIIGNIYENPELIK